MFPSRVEASGDDGSNMKREDQHRSFLRPHVLIVSDEASLSEFLGEGLMHGGFWTSVVASGLQTLEVFRLRQFDIVLIDASLSGFQCLELVRRLLGRSGRGDGVARTHAPILLVAESASEVSVAAAREAGAQGVLYAPLELEEVVQALHRLFAEWREAHPHLPMADDASARSAGA